MHITEIRTTLLDDASRTNDRILAYASVTFDDQLVVRDLKIIKHEESLFVAFPSRKLSVRCKSCKRASNPIQANYCNYCGVKLPKRAEWEPDSKLHADICHPITSELRQQVTVEVLRSYSLAIADAELARGREKVPA